MIGKSWSQKRRRFLEHKTAHSDYYVTCFDVNVLYVCVCVTVCPCVTSGGKRERERRGRDNPKNNSNKTLPLSYLTRCMFRSSFIYYQWGKQQKNIDSLIFSFVSSFFFNVVRPCLTIGWLICFKSISIVMFLSFFVFSSFFCMCARELISLVYKHKEN